MTPAPFITFLLPLPVALLGLFGHPSVRRSLFVALRPWCRLFTLYGPRLLPLILARRGSLLGLGLGRRCSADVFIISVLWRRTLNILLPRTFHGSSFPPFPLRS